MIWYRYCSIAWAGNLLLGLILNQISSSDDQVLDSNEVNTVEKRPSLLSKTKMLTNTVCVANGTSCRCACSGNYLVGRK